MVLENINTKIIQNIPSHITDLEIKNNYILTKEDYNNLVVYTNVTNIKVYDIDNFEYGNEINITIEKNIEFKTDRFKKININKINGYKKDSLSIHLPFTKDEAEDFNKLLKYIKKIDIINITINNENIDQIFNIIYKIEENTNHKISSINIITENKTIPDIEKLKLLEDNRLVKIWYEDGITDCTIDEFITMRKNLDKIILDVKSKPLTNFEKVIYVYDIVKKFKFLPSNDFYSMDGRHLHKIFNTQNIVCSGFSRIMTEVLNELGIKSSIYKLKTHDNTLHSRSLVHIIDEKYGINTICSMEPTWESAINETYAYSLFLTPINKLKEWFPKETFYGDIEVLTGNKKINEINLKDRISLYRLFNDFDLTQEVINNTLKYCTNINLNTFINALINVRCYQGISKNIVVSNINNIVKYNGELINYLNNKMGTNISFFN